MNLEVIAWMLLFLFLGIGIWALGVIKEQPGQRESIHDAFEKIWEELKKEEDI